LFCFSLDLLYALDATFAHQRCPTPHQHARQAGVLDDVICRTVPGHPSTPPAAVLLL
jgi:hypothetical protein